MEVFLMTAALSQISSQFQNCTVLSDVNGCSVPFGLKVPFKDEFTPACLNHDVCYRCGVTYGWNQLQCDDGFKKLMQNICYHKYGTSSSGRKRGITDWFKEKWRKFKEYTKEKWRKFKEFEDKISRGWEEARKNATSKEEIARLAKSAKDLISMGYKFYKMDDGEEKCLLAADIFHKSVADFGVYKYRYENKPYCKEPCAAQLGKPI